MVMPKKKQHETRQKPQNRRSLRKNKKTKFQSNLVFVGVNAAGLSSKLSSFDSMLVSLNPTVFFIWGENKNRKLFEVPNL